MTGCFTFKGTVEKKTEINNDGVELPGEVIEALHYWWYHAKRGDKFEIECELEV